MRNASDRTMPKKAYAKCVPNETVSHKKLVKEVTEHLRFFPHGMMEAVLEEVFNRLSEHLAQGDRVSKKNIKGAHIVFAPCRKLKETFADMEYKMIPRIF